MNLVEKVTAFKLQTRALNAAIESAQDRLQQGCVAHFDGYMDQLLDVAAGDPDPDNKQAFSDFLVWAADTGLLSRRQAQETWNRYFNVKFVSLRGDYNNCAQTCPVGVDNGLITREIRKLFSQELGIAMPELHEAGTVKQLTTGSSTGSLRAIAGGKRSWW